MKKSNFMLVFTVIMAIGITGNIFAQDRIPDSIVQAFRAARLPVVNGTPARDFILPMLDGSHWSLSQQRGKVVFLNFWATWCPPCRDEMPSMESVYQKLKDNGFVMIAVNLKESRNDVSNFMRRNGLSFPVVLDSNGAIGSVYNVRAIPTTYIINKQGLIVSRLEGSIDWDNPRIITALELLLAE